MRIEAFQPRNGHGTVDLGGFNVPIKSADEAVFSATTAEVLARDGNGVPVLFSNKYGKGRTYLLAFAPEAEPDHELYEGEFYKIYSRVCPVKRLVSVAAPNVTVSDHFVSSDKAYVVLVNNDLNPFDGALEVSAGWRVDGTRTDRSDLASLDGNRLRLAPGAGVLLTLTKAQ